EIVEQRLPAAAAALRVADHLLMLEQVAILAVAVGLARPLQLVAGHLRAQQPVAPAGLVLNDATCREQAEAHLHPRSRQGSNGPDLRQRWRFRAIVQQLECVMSVDEIVAVGIALGLEEPQQLAVRWIVKQRGAGAIAVTAGSTEFLIKRLGRARQVVM